MLMTTPSTAEKQAAAAGPSSSQGCDPGCAFTASRARGVTLPQFTSLSRIRPVSQGDGEVGRDQLAVPVGPEQEGHGSCGGGAGREAGEGHIVPGRGPAAGSLFHRRPLLWPRTSDSPVP